MISQHHIYIAYLNKGNSLSEQRDGDDEDESSCRLVDGSVGRDTAGVYKTLQISWHTYNVAQLREEVVDRGIFTIHKIYSCNNIML